MSSFVVVVVVCLFLGRVWKEILKNRSCRANRGLKKIPHMAKFRFVQN